MLEEGYASVTYRHVAAEAGVTAGLVQYYFPTLDDLFVGLLRRRTSRNLEKLRDNLANTDCPLRTLWEYSRDETSAALMTELMALGNHRKAIRAEIGQRIEAFRELEVEAFRDAYERYGLSERELPPEAALFLLLGIPKLILMEADLGVHHGHAEILAFVELYLQRLEPLGKVSAPAKPKTPSQRRARSKARSA
jgi:TetR/AcrR family transcriptional regulator, transcriptional repressor for nem operon